MQHKFGGAQKGTKRRETALAQLLKVRIQREGPITFRDFMEAALYDPTHGFYSKGPAIGTRDGSFNTNAMYAPFAYALAHVVERAEILAGEALRIIELGGGTGQLASAILHFLPEPHEYVIVDPSAGLRHKQAACGLRTIPSLSPLPPLPSFVFGNEVLDAMPVHRVMGLPGGKVMEQYVAIDANEGLVEHFADPSTTLLADQLRAEGITLGRGQIAEINLSLGSFMEALTQVTPKGYVLFIDYGDDGPALYHYRRRNGTLRCFKSQSQTYDPFDDVGDQDLTADVDFTAVEKAATEAGFLSVGKSSQGQWLKRLGIETYLERSDVGETAREDIHHLISPARLGSTFEVIAFKTVGLPNLPGFENR